MKGTRRALLQRLQIGTVVVLSSIDWGFLWQRHQVFASYWAELVSTLWIDNLGFRPVSWRDIPRLVVALRQRLTVGGPREPLMPVPEQLTIIRPWILPPSSRGWTEYLNRAFLVPRLATVLGKYHTDNALMIVYIPTRTALEVIRRLKPRVVVYDCVANFTEHPAAPAGTDQTERELLAAADVVLTDSTYLFERLQPLHPHVLQVHHGVNVGLFTPGVQVAPTTSPRVIMYFGGISRWLDYPLLNHLGSLGYRIRLVGKVTDRLPGLHGNVSIEGPHPPKELAAILQEADALILPYLPDSPFFRGVIPAKIYECLATGKPVLSAWLPNYDDELKGVLYIYRDRHEAANLISVMADWESKETVRERIAYAQGFASERQFDKILAFLDTVLAGATQERTSP